MTMFQFNVIITLVNSSDVMSFMAAKTQFESQTIQDLNLNVCTCFRSTSVGREKNNTKTFCSNKTECSEASDRSKHLCLSYTIKQVLLSNNIININNYVKCQSDWLHALNSTRSSQNVVLGSSLGRHAHALISSISNKVEKI